MAEYKSTGIRAARLRSESERPVTPDVESWQEPETEEPALPQRTPEPSNLDRALAPADRRRVRAVRHGTEGARPGPEASPPEHFIVVLDRAHLNIYQVRNSGRAARARFDPVETAHLPAGLQHYTDRDADQAGRFGARVGPSGGSIDERLPMRNEHERRLAADLADRLGRFLERHGHATWDYAAGPALHHAVLDRLASGVRARLDRALPKELVHQTPAELEAHFAR